MRVGIVAFLAVCVMMWAGSAWADANSVAQIIRDYGLEAAVSGNTITVTGSKPDATLTGLRLPDISGLTIDWRADLTCIAGTPPSESGIYYVFVRGNGTLKINDGTITLPAPNSTTSGKKITAISGNGVNIEVFGGMIRGSEIRQRGLDLQNGTMTINGGKIAVPCDTALMVQDGRLALITPESITGGVIVTNEEITKADIGIYGQTTATTKDVESNFGNHKLETVTYKVKDGAVWTIDSITSNLTNVASIYMNVENGGTLNLKDAQLEFNGAMTVEDGGELNLDEDSIIIVNGEVYNGSKASGNARAAALDDPNKSVINNKGVLNVSTQGKLTNNGIVNNTGTITNKGTIDNTNGVINNQGTFESFQEIGGEVQGNDVQGNDVAPIETETSTSGGGGGCNAGYGILGLLFAGLVTRKYLKA
jgi:hypothetical protein